jgi:raffinose/stachyose/melibiose transport system substrate-binding protein
MTAPPKSVADLTALLAKAKAAGLTGLVASNAAGGVVFPYQLMINSSMGPKTVAAWVFNAPNATIDTPPSVQAATVLQGWVNSGYLPKGVNGMDSTASDALFTSGKGVFYPWGNWDAATFDKSMAGNVGFMTMPPVTAGGQVAAMSDAATAFGIPSKSTNKDAAAQFLNFLSSDEARQIAIDNGFMPTGLASQPAPKIKAGSVLTDVVAAFNQISAVAGQVPFVQNATPGISNQAWNPESQLLVAGKSTLQQFATNVQAKYEDKLK